MSSISYYAATVFTVCLLQSTNVLGEVCYGARAGEISVTTFSISGSRSGGDGWYCPASGLATTGQAASDACSVALVDGDYSLAANTISGYFRTMNVGDYIDFTLKAGAMELKHWNIYAEHDFDPNCKFTLYGVHTDGTTETALPTTGRSSGFNTLVWSDTSSSTDSSGSSMNRSPPSTKANGLWGFEVTTNGISYTKYRIKLTEGNTESNQACSRNPSWLEVTFPDVSGCTIVAATAPPSTPAPVTPPVTPAPVQTTPAPVQTTPAPVQSATPAPVQTPVTTPTPVTPATPAPITPGPVAAAACTLPTFAPGVVSKQCSSGGSLASGSSCLVSCSSAIPVADSGSTTYTCNSGTLTQASLTCSCQLPAFGTNVIGLASSGYAACNAEASLQVGSSCQVGCANGFESSVDLAKQPALHSCSATGLEIPKINCAAKPCTLPSTLPEQYTPGGVNPCKSGGSLASGKSCTMSCNKGFVDSSEFDAYTCAASVLQPAKDLDTRCACIVPAKFGNNIVEGLDGSSKCVGSQSLTIGQSCQVMCAKGYAASTFNAEYVCNGRSGLSTPSFVCEALQYDTYLRAHNTLRSSVGLPLVSYSQQLEQAAMRTAATRASGTCSTQPTGTQTLAQQFFETGVGAGEIIDDGTPSDTWDTVLAKWWRERTFYSYGASGATCTSSPGTSVTKFTQVAWTCTTLVGCARSACTGGTSEILVCLYGPAGNSAGYVPFTPSVAVKADILPTLGSAECGNVKGIQPACGITEPPVAIPTEYPNLFTPAPVTPTPVTPVPVQPETCARDPSCFDNDYTCASCCLSGGTSLTGYPCFDTTFYTVNRCCLNAAASGPVQTYLTMSGQIEAFTPVVLSRIRDVLAVLLGTPPNLLSVALEAGSVVLRVTLPADTVQVFTNMVNTGAVSSLGGFAVEAISREIPATAAPVQTFGAGGEFRICAKDPTCFDTLYSCESCCQSGVTSPGTGAFQCWNNFYSAARCCNSVPVSQTPSPSQPQYNPVNPVIQPTTAAPTVGMCARDLTCFDAVYTCASCCQSGVATDGTNCWDFNFTPERCCLSQTTQVAPQLPEFAPQAVFQQSCIEKDPGCFNERYTCASCCGSGRNVAGEQCWFGGYTEQRCCGAPGILTTNAPSSVQTFAYYDFFGNPCPVLGVPCATSMNSPPVIPALGLCSDTYPAMCPVWAALGQCTMSTVGPNCRSSCGGCIGRRSEPIELKTDSRGHPSILGVRYHYEEGRLVDSRGHVAAPDAKSFLAQRRQPAESPTSSNLPLALGLGAAAVAVLGAMVAVGWRKKYSSVSMLT